jgi:FtsP/CotA-like multicopper oxidase with cupredoxin domain
MTDTNSTRRRFLQLAGFSGISLIGLNQLSQWDDEPITRNNVATKPIDSSIQLNVAQDNVHPDGGEPSQKYLYNSSYPAPELRIEENDTFAAAVTNHLSPDTTVHWHGVPVPNRMDGVPNVTQDPIPSGGSFLYSYTASPAGTYLYHSHVGLQPDWGLKGPLIIEEHDPHVEYDREYTVLLDEYLGSKPPTDAGFPTIPSYDGLMINGKLPGTPPNFEVEEGERVRFRLINAGSATTFRIALAGHPMTVAFADGRPVEPIEVESVVLGVAERFDVIVTMDEPGSWVLEATPVNGDDIGNPQLARGVIQYQRSAPSKPMTPSTDGRQLQYGDLKAKESYEGISGKPDRTYSLTLSRGPKQGSWAINNQIYSSVAPFQVDALQIKPSEHIRFHMKNPSEMFHPMHLHGHFFQVQDAILDTVLVPPGELE